MEREELLEIGMRIWNESLSGRSGFDFGDIDDDTWDDIYVSIGESVSEIFK